MIINHDDDSKELLLTHPFQLVPKHYQTGLFHSFTNCERKVFSYWHKICFFFVVVVVVVVLHPVSV